AVEAARAIPDSENAAILYDQLLEDVNAASLYDQIESIYGDRIVLTRAESPSKNENTDPVAWIKECQWLIDRLLTISRFEKCRFPIDIELSTIQLSRINRMLIWMSMLKHASDIDVAEGRINDAIEKWRCLIRIGGHLQQQPLTMEYHTGITLESVAIHETSAFIVEGKANEHCLHEISSFPLGIKDKWAAILGRMLPVKRLAEQRYKEQLSPIKRFKYELGYGSIAKRKDPLLERIHWTYSNNLALRRAFHLLIALRRHRNAHGHWPDSLEAIRSEVSGEIFVDPISKHDFVYKTTGDGFTLYSRGYNKIDEGGESRTESEDGPDDWCIREIRKLRGKAPTTNS
ncbi:MAG: hypothetical protein ACYTE3_22265, partial [Planctomycetota bacterium]